MEKTDDQMLRSMCQFLACDDEEKSAFLPPHDASRTYMYNECGDRTDNPLFYYCSSAYELMTRNGGGGSGEFSSLILDISAMSSVMLWLEPQFTFMWCLDKTKHGLSGEVDRFWSVL